MFNIKKLTKSRFSNAPQQTKKTWRNLLSWKSVNGVLAYIFSRSMLFIDLHTIVSYK